MSYEYIRSAPSSSPLQDVDEIELLDQGGNDFSWMEEEKETDVATPAQETSLSIQTQVENGTSEAEQPTQEVGMPKNHSEMDDLSLKK